MKNCVYQFLNKEEEIIYIGKAKDLDTRLRTHNHLPRECYEEIAYIKYCTFCSEYEMDLAERYYIPKIKPKYNMVLSDKYISMSIECFDSKEWRMYKKVSKEKQAKNNPPQSKKKEYAEKLKHAEERMLLEEKQKRERIINRKIINPFTREIFDNLYSVSKTYGISLDLLISYMTKKTLLQTIHPVYGGYLAFQYYEEFMECFNKNEKHYNNLFEESTRKVACLTTGEIFINATKAMDYYGIKKSLIRRCCANISNYCGEVYEHPLVWKWYDEYTNMTKEQIDSYIKKASNIRESKIKNKRAG